MPVGFVLKRVRELRNLEVGEVAASTGMSERSLADFEDDRRNPSYAQLENLAEVYGVAPYTLNHSDVPNLPELLADFRTSNARPARLSPSGLKRLWAAETRSQFARQLGSDVKLGSPDWLSNVPQGSLDANHARDLRSFFQEWFTERRDELDFVGSEEQIFMQCFRLFMEVQGLVVNINDAEPEDYLGFYVRPDEGFPLAFVNRKISSKKAQLFTLLHETCHHFENIEGVSNPFIVRNAAERRCNRFAAEFLAPQREFAKLASERQQGSDLLGYVNDVSQKSLLSRQATAIRLFEEKYITEQQLGTCQRTFASQPKREKEEEKAEIKGGQQHAKRIGELGYLPVYLAAIAVDRKLVDSVDVRQGLALAEPTQPKAFDLAKRRVDVALRA